MATVIYMYACDGCSVSRIIYTVHVYVGTVVMPFWFA